MEGGGEGEEGRVREEGGLGRERERVPSVAGQAWEKEGGKGGEGKNMAEPEVL